MIIREKYTKDPTVLHESRAALEKVESLTWKFAAAPEATPAASGDNGEGFFFICLFEATASKL